MKKLTNETAKVHTTIRMPLALRNRIYKQVEKHNITLTDLVISLLSQQKLIANTIEKIKLGGLL